MHRRARWLDDERERLRAEQEERDRVKEEKVEEAKVEIAPPPAEKKKVVEEITLDDTDDDEELMVVSVRKEKGKRKEVAQTKKVKKGTKRKSEEANLASRPQMPKRTSSARSNSNDTTSAPPNPLPLPNRLAKLPSFKRTNRPSRPLLLPLPPPDAPTISEESAEQRSAPIFVPNHSATLAHELPSFLREDATKDSQGRFAFRPPPPGPFFTPLSPTADEDPDGKAPAELVKQLTTLIFPSLDNSVTAHLLLLFLARNQPRLPPRPIGMRREYGTILVAFKSYDDAQQTIEMATGKQLPWVDDEDLRTLEPQLYTSWLEENEEPGYIEAREERAEELGEEWVPVDWKWGEMSDEVRRDWRKFQQLPRARVMPRLDVPPAIFVSQEYSEETSLLMSPESFTANTIETLRTRRRRLTGIKIDIYQQRCTAWNEWYQNNPVSEDFTTRPPIPSYPADSDCHSRLKEIEKKEWEDIGKRMEELEQRLQQQVEEIARLRTVSVPIAVASSHVRLLDRLKRRDGVAPPPPPATPPNPSSSSSKGVQESRPLFTTPANSSFSLARFLKIRGAATAGGKEGSLVDPNSKNPT